MNNPFLDAHLHKLTIYIVNYGIGNSVVNLIIIF